MSIKILIIKGRLRLDFARLHVRSFLSGQKVSRSDIFRMMQKYHPKTFNLMHRKVNEYLHQELTIPELLKEVDKMTETDFGIMNLRIDKEDGNLED